MLSSFVIIRTKIVIKNENEEEKHHKHHKFFFFTHNMDSKPRNS